MNFAAGDAIGVFTNAKQMDVKSNEMYGKSWADLSEAERQWLLLDTVNKTYEMNGALNQSARESGEYANVMGNLKATWDEFLQTIGQPILDATITTVQGLTTAIQDGITFVTEFDTHWQNLKTLLEENETTITIVSIAVGTLTAAIIAYNAASILSAIQSGAMTVALTAMYIAEGIAATATTALGAAIGFMTSPITLTVLAIGALIAIGVLLYKNWDTVKAKAGELANSVSTKFSDIKNGISDKINGAKDVVKSAIDKIKGFFNFKWEFPKLKMPHFNIKGKFSLNPPSVPKLGIDWYKEGGIFNSPSVIGVGEGKGAEAVLPIEKLSGILADTLQKILPTMPSGYNSALANAKANRMYNNSTSKSENNNYGNNTFHINVNVEKLENEIDYDMMGKKVTDSLYNTVKNKFGLQVSVPRMR